MLLITDVLIDCIAMQIISACSLAYTESISVASNTLKKKSQFFFFPYILNWLLPPEVYSCCEIELVIWECQYHKFFSNAHVR